MERTDFLGGLCTVWTIVTLICKHNLILDFYPLEWSNIQKCLQSQFMGATLRNGSPQSPSYALCGPFRFPPFIEENPTGNATDMQHVNNVVTMYLVYQTCYWHAAVKCQSNAVFKRLRRRAVLHSRHRIATSLCILLPLFKYFVWTGYNHFHTSQHSKVLVDTGSCAQLGLQMMCSWGLVVRAT